jgi:sulfite reductase (ferredoxin)
MPEVVAEIQNELNAVAAGRCRSFCAPAVAPNGCSRPYTAQIGIVGASVDMYSLYLGASNLGTRIGALSRRTSSAATSRRASGLCWNYMLELYKDTRRSGERFGDFCHRIGVEALRELSAGVPA